MPADEVTHGTAVGESRARSGPRHAAPKKPLLTRLNMPAGKAIALAAMPTAVLMGMGFTPTLALAEDPSSQSLTADEYKDCVTALEAAEDDTDTSASPTPTPSASATESADSSDDEAKDEDKPADDDSSDDSASDDTTPDDSSSPDSGSDDKDTAKDTAADATATPSPSPSESTDLDDCFVATDDESGVEKGIPALPSEPWYLNASSLLLKGADYKGVVKGRTADGKVKEVLKYVISDGTDIGDLHQTVDDKQAGVTYHVQAGKGTTSTIRDGQTVMYTESISGNLLGLIPVTFDPKHPPPLNIPLIYFTKVKVVQAGQFGGTLTVPGLHQFTTK